MNGKTGATFSKIIRYQAKHKQLANMSLYENIPGLAKAPRVNGQVLTMHESNLAATMQLLDELTDQSCFALQLDPRMFAGPQSRPRLYLPAFRRSYMEELDVGPEELYAVITKYVKLLSGGYGLIDLQKLILPRDHAAITQYLAECTAMATTTTSSPSPPVVAESAATAVAEAEAEAAEPDKEEVAALKWQRLHQQVAMKCNIVRCTAGFLVAKSMKEQYPALHQLTSREQDVLGIKHATIVS